MFKQCKLKKENTYRVTWLPAKFAIKGLCVKLRDNKQWDDGWIIEEVWGSKKDNLVLVDRDSYKYQRRMSDI